MLFHTNDSCCVTVVKSAPCQIFVTAKLVFCTPQAIMFSDTEVLRIVKFYEEFEAFMQVYPSIAYLFVLTTLSIAFYMYETHRKLEHTLQELELALQNTIELSNVNEQWWAHCEHLTASEAEIALRYQNLLASNLVLPQANLSARRVLICTQRRTV